MWPWTPPHKGFLAASYIRHLPTKVSKPDCVVKHRTKQPFLTCVVVVTIRLIISDIHLTRSIRQWRSRACLSYIFVWSHSPLILNVCWSYYFTLTIVSGNWVSNTKWRLRVVHWHWLSLRQFRSFCNPIGFWRVMWLRSDWVTILRALVRSVAEMLLLILGHDFSSCCSRREWRWECVWKKKIYCCLGYL